MSNDDSTGRVSLTTADAEYQNGLEAGRIELAKFGPDSDAIARRLKFDRMRAETAQPVFAAFHQGRVDGMSGS